MTTLRPPPNWYSDPTGRHEARYWDGSTWTGHVADRGQAGVDPLAPVAGPGGHGGHRPVGPGTVQLQALARARQEHRAVHGEAIGAASGEVTGAVQPIGGSSPIPPILAPRRRRRALLDIATIGCVAFMVVAGVALLASTGVLHRGDDHSTSGFSSSFDGNGYHVQVPPDWRRIDVPVGVQLDARYVVSSDQRILVGIGVGLDPAGELSDPAVRDQTLATVARVLLASVSADGEVVEARFLDGFGHPTAIVTVDAVTGDRGTVRLVEYMVIGAGRAVLIAISGPPDAVFRQQVVAADVVRSVEFD